MYLTPGMLFKTFTWEQRETTLDTRGKQGLSWTEQGTVIGILSDSSPNEKLTYQQMQHPITHDIAQQGAPVASEGDRLSLDGRHFYVQDVLNPGGLSLWTVYKCEERRDL